jgi:phosphoserine phosphatase
LFDEGVGETPFRKGHGPKSLFFKIKMDQIIDMDFHIPNPEDKLTLINAQGIYPENSIVAGDGYTDRPLLNWAGIPVLIDRTGKKKAQYARKGYHVISSIPEIVEIIEKDFV